MATLFGQLRTRARNEKRRTFNPEEAPPHGDWPYLDISPLRDLDRDANYRFVNIILAIIAAFIIASAAIFVFLAISIAAPRKAHARDDGRYANEPLHTWFDQLASGKGLCWSFADGVSIQDVDWDTSDGRYRVRLHGEWILVPENALVTEPNRFGPAVVWPYESEGQTQIRCFLPGAGA